MEIRFKHWIYGAIAISVLGAVTNWPADRRAIHRRYSAPITPERAAARELQRELSAARGQLAMAEKRDEILAGIDSARDQTQLVVVIDEAVPGPLRAVLETELDSVWAEVAPVADNGIRFALHVGVADRYKPRTLWYAIPEGLDGTTCLSSVTLNLQRIRDELDRGVQPSDVLQRQIDLSTRSGASVSRGPCAFYSAFGPPGAHVKQWLVSHNLDFARLADWARPQPKAKPPVRIDISSGLEPRVRLVGSLGFSGLNSHACASGRAASCRGALLRDAELERTNFLPARLNARGRAGTLDGWFGTSFPFRTTVFGPPTNHFLSDVVREVGPERFEEFWTSDLPVDEAFASIVGRDIGEWTSDWLAAEIGRYHFGPGVRAAEVFVVILLAGIGALAGAYVAEKRKTG